jgi:hypothetical protein
MSWLIARCRIACQIALLASIGILGIGAIVAIDQWGRGKIAEEQAVAAAAEAGRQSDGVMDHTTGLNEAITELRLMLVRTVRTSTAEVDRRLFERAATDLPCQIAVTGQPPTAGRIVDLSEGGARLATAKPLPDGATGTLRVDGIQAAIAFVVRGTDRNGARILFAADEAGRAAVRALTGRMALKQAA